MSCGDRAISSVTGLFADIVPGQTLVKVVYQLQPFTLLPLFDLTFNPDRLLKRIEFSSYSVQNSGLGSSGTCYKVPLRVKSCSEQELLNIAVSVVSAKRCATTETERQCYAVCLSALSR